MEKKQQKSEKSEKQEIGKLRVKSSLVFCLIFCILKQKRAFGLGAIFFSPVLTFKNKNKSNFKVNNDADSC